MPEIPLPLSLVSARDSHMPIAFSVAAGHVPQLRLNVTRDGLGLAELGNRVIAEQSTRLPDHSAAPRTVDPNKARELQHLLSQGGVIVMRHGIQFFEGDNTALTVDTQKIRFMQAPYNLTDPADDASICEAAAIGVVFEQIRMFHGIKPLSFKVLTSTNWRAAEIASLISFLSEHHRLLEDSRLKCMDYPNLPADKLHAILGLGNKGSLTWDQGVIDGIGGAGTYQTLLEDMRALLRENLNPGTLTVLLTHTPQMNAVDHLLGETPKRSPELGFRVVTKTQTKVFPNSIFI